ncbi:Hypothetical predicted protein [Pelobates cultripes]|uniref:Uncharacterized protein n=1 Tax=Pelobates cultripes TaxID=61616 RepID=A0AAD1R0P5_PELCU|nr:Hypothetical predicted protein [Pelobates cultripes]
MELNPKQDQHQRQPHTQCGNMQPHVGFCEHKWVSTWYQNRLIPPKDTSLPQIGIG